MGALVKGSFYACSKIWAFSLDYLFHAIGMLAHLTFPPGVVYQSSVPHGGEFLSLNGKISGFFPCVFGADGHAFPPGAVFGYRIRMGTDLF